MSGELRSFEAEGAGDDVAAARQEALRSLRSLAGGWPRRTSSSSP